MLKPCRHCRKEFWAHHRSNQCCSRKCAHALVKRPVVLRCLVCGKEIITKPSLRARRKTCSHACAALHLSRIHKGKRLWTRRASKPLATFACRHCGDEKQIAAYRLALGEGQFCSRKCSNAAYDRTGANNSNWRGGITPKLKLLRETKEYKAWRAAVFRRDRWTCVTCGYRSRKRGDIHADHVRPFAFFTEDRLTISNGQTLCVDCHRKTPTYGSGARKAIETFPAA